MEFFDHITDVKGIFSLHFNINNTCEDCLLHGDVFSPLSFTFDPDIKEQRIAGIMEGLISFFSVLQFLSGFQLCSDVIQQEPVPYVNKKHIFTFGYWYASLWLRHAIVASDYVGVIVYGFGVLLFCGYNLTYGYLKVPSDALTYQYPIGRMMMLMFFNAALLIADLSIVLIHYTTVTLYYLSPAIFMHYCKQSHIWMSPQPMMFLNLIVAILKFGRGIVLENIMVSYLWAILLASISVRAYCKYQCENKDCKREIELEHEAEVYYAAIRHTHGY